MQQNKSAVASLSAPAPRERFCANNYQVVLDSPELERVVAAGADASGPAHAATMSACPDADNFEYCAKMSVGIDLVYRKHCHVNNNEGVRVWLPITAFVDPATVTDLAERQCMELDQPNVVGERTLIGDPVALKAALVTASARHVDMFDETDFAAIAGQTCKVVYEDQEEGICNLCVKVEETGFHYAFFAGNEAFQTP